MTARHPSSGPAGMEPLTPQRKWRAITYATLLLVPAFWALLAGLVSGASDDGGGVNVAAAVALGLALVPFVFVVLAFASEHPHAPGAVVKAMWVSLAVGIPASAVAADAVTGIVAGVGAGGVYALRADASHNRRDRWIAVGVAAVYAFVLVRTIGAVALLPAPVFPFTAIGIADHVSERRASRQPSAV